MKLNELLELVNFDFDYCDKDWDVTFYAYVEKDNEWAKCIDVTLIDKNHVVCDFTKFINQHKTLIQKLIKEHYKDEYVEDMLNALDNPRDYEETFCDIIIGEVVRDLLEE